MEAGIVGPILVVMTIMLPVLMRKAMAEKATGSHGDPLPPVESAPPDHLFEMKSESSLSRERLAFVLRRRWRSMYGDDLTPEQLAPLLAHVMLATGGGKQILNHNLFGQNASRFWRGQWTVTRSPAWRNSRAVVRWSPMRAYLSPDAAAADWFRGLLPPIVEAVRRGDTGAYANLLVEAGYVKMPARLFRPELKGEARRLLGQT